MILYLSLFIPIIISIGLYFFFDKNIKLLRIFGILFISSLIIVFTSKLIIEQIQTTSKEYRGSFISKVEYYEDWDEWIEQTCTRTCCCDSEGNNCQTETYDCSYVSYHSAYWVITTTTNEKIRITESQYNQIKKIFGNEVFLELNRDYHSDDGDCYYSYWDENDSLKSIPVTTLHTYSNKIKAADQSVFHFSDVNENDIIKYSLKNYPEINEGYKMKSILCDEKIPINRDELDDLDKKFQYINSKLGHKKQVRVFVLLFVNQPYEASLFQQSYWQGGNMNEFIICIGLDSINRKVKWANVISWTPVEILKTEIKRFIEGQDTLDLDKIANYTYVKIDEKFTRRDFKEFDYLDVEPPTWYIILIYIILILFNLFFGYYLINKI